MFDNDLADFNRFYEDSIKSIELPQRLSKDYKIVDCLKESDIKHILLLEAEDGTRWVLKAYKAEYAALLENEYQILVQMRKKNNCPVPKAKDYWCDEEHAYLLREFIAGGSLYSMYEDGYIRCSETVIRIAMELCAIIEKLHSETPPIIHRDIKPENFIWNKTDERLYLIDCDSARFYKEGKERDTYVLGTPNHAAPEAYGYAQCDVRSDVYGIGKTILCLCCGCTDDKAVDECNIPQGLRKIIRRCIAFSPDERYPQVKAIHHDLQKLYDRKYRKIPSSYKMKYGAGMLVAVLLAFCLGMVFERGLVQTGTKEADTEHTEVSGGQSLAETSDRISIDVSEYREYVERIVTCYYEMDIEGMGEAYDELFAKLYAAEDLQALEWTDVSKLDEIPENYPLRPYPYRLCDPLACYDNILYTKIGNYDYYADLIYGYLDFYLNEDTASQDNPFYQYCNGDAAVQKENYKEALAEVINCALRAIMDQDGLEFLNP